MIIEIKGCGCHNKGAEMMLLTILQELKSDEIKFCVPAGPNLKYECYSKYGLYPKLWLNIKGFQIGKIGKFIPKRLREIYGIIIDEEVDVILDASGFAYSSQWGDSPTIEMAKNVLRWKKQRKKIILLPQAFGPFDNEVIRKHMKIIIENADLVFARDEDSFNYLYEISKSENIKLYPDFTILFKGKLPPYWDNKLEVAVVPNKRMKDKRKDSEQYEIFMKEVIEYFQKNGVQPFFLIFGGKEDEELANSINNLLKKKIPLIIEGNPYFIKGIIASTRGLVGSRFHSLVCALNSNVIAIGTGWSHKYRNLFKEYDFEDGLIDFNMDFDVVKNRLNLIISNDKKVKEKLEERNAVLENKAKEMFNIVKGVIFGK